MTEFWIVNGVTPSSRSPAIEYAISSDPSPYWSNTTSRLAIMCDHVISGPQ